MARSYFALSEFYKSQKYFNELVNNYPDSKYHNESRLWLEYSNLKLNIFKSLNKFGKKSRDLKETINYILSRTK